MTLKRIHTHNLQSHKDVTIELPETGIVAFTGNNSNGKSVIAKVTNAILSGEISRPKERRTLINRQFNSGFVEYERYDGSILKVVIHVEAAQTYAEYTKPDGQVIRRYLADKAIPQMVHDFGFNYNPDHGVSLNIHNDDDKFLFVNTKHTTNCACLSDTLSDSYGEQALQQLTLTLEEVKGIIKNLEKEKITAETILSSLPTCNIDDAETRRKKMLYIAKNLKHFPETKCPKAVGVPSVVTLNLPTNLPKIKYPTIINLPLEFPDIVQLGRDLNDVLKGVCPTCKRAFFS